MQKLRRSSQKLMRLLLVRNCISSNDIASYHFQPYHSTDEDDWNVIIRDCSSLASKWEQLSGFLGLKISIISRIRSNKAGDCLGCWNDALMEWITRNYNTEKFGEPSWKTLLRAVAAVNRLQFKKLAAEHQG